MRIRDELSTVRAVRRAAAAARRLRAVLLRGRTPRSTPGGRREHEGAGRVAGDPARRADADSVARTLLDELAARFDVEFVALTFVSDDAREATGCLGRSRGDDVDWWRSLRLDLEHEPSGIASAAFDAAALTVYDAQGSGVVSRRLAGAVGAKSAAFIPLLVGERVTGVVSLATLDERRVFPSESLVAMQELVSEAALALEPLRAKLALEESE